MTKTPSVDRATLRFLEKGWVARGGRKWVRLMPKRLQEEIYLSDIRRGLISEIRQVSGDHLSHSAAMRRRAFQLLDLWALLLPARIATEELGDYLEDIDRRAAKGQHWLIITARVVAAIIWTSINMVGYVMKALLGKAQAS